MFSAIDPELSLNIVNICRFEDQCGNQQIAGRDGRANDDLTS